jgi:hypothetical protein
MIPPLKNLLIDIFANFLGISCDHKRNIKAWDHKRFFKGGIITERQFLIKEGS